MTQIKPRVFRTVAELLGGHYHVAIFSAPDPTANFAKLGDIVMDEHDYPQFCDAFTADHQIKGTQEDYVAKFWDDFGGPRRPDDFWKKRWLSPDSERIALEKFNKWIANTREMDNGIGYAVGELWQGDRLVKRYERDK